LEKKGIINTNPVAKTSMDSGLSEEGKEQALKAALELEAMGACEGSCWIWPSITQRAYQAAEIIAAVNNIGRRQVASFIFIQYPYAMLFCVCKLKHTKQTAVQFV
jgi:broad specificity phosphatase PhoE